MRRLFENPWIIVVLYTELMTIVIVEFLGLSRVIEILPLLSIVWIFRDNLLIKINNWAKV